MFRAQQGGSLYLFLALGAAISAGLFFALTLVPPRARKPLVATVTFLSGLFYALEWLWPTATAGPQAGKNFLSGYKLPLSEITTVLQGFALGIGIYSLVGLHLRNIVRRRAGWGNSLVLLAALFVMAIPGILRNDHPNRYNKNLYALTFDGGYVSLNSAMFSIVAFYIVSAAYRAFRLRSVEATILLLSAAIIMLGQVALGQALTNAAPMTGFAANFRVENLANWILTKVNSPAVQAVEFGLGIGALATALRLWLSLERGSYFEEEL